MPMGDGPNDARLSRHPLIASCEASLRRLDALVEIAERRDVSAAQVALAWLLAPYLER